ncbi:CBO0543 family protein [Evansella halocellulosilytica]|uniref:CBO0543 family protein n=1 Tax=Evansella halocellulosilytica TaxID=2011013 RepID=UPI000BB962C4|nr:CBO0543 family protein [Evansella halocellulosilytica]
MKQKQIALILFIFILNIFGKSWRYVPKYYRSLIFISFLNSLYYYICKRHLVWEFNTRGVNWRLLRAIQTFFITPSLVILFLSKLPDTLLKRIVHVIKWVTCSSLIEHFIHKKKMIRFKYGWNIYWSTLIYIKMYVYSYLFYINPLFACILSLCSLIFFIITFQVPLTTRFLKGSITVLFPKKGRLQMLKPKC